MIAAVMVAVFMAVYVAVMRLPHWMPRLRTIRSVSYAIFIYMISHPIVAFLAVALFVSVVQFVAFWNRFRSLRRRPGQRARRADGPNPHTEADRRGELKRV
jgi:hypothetical protein